MKNKLTVIYQRGMYRVYRGEDGRFFDDGFSLEFGEINITRPKNPASIDPMHADDVRSDLIALGVPVLPADVTTVCCAEEDTLYRELAEEGRQDREMYEGAN